MAAIRFVTTLSWVPPFFAGFVILTAVPETLAQLPTTKLWHVYPAGGQVGAVVDIELGGQDFEDVEAVYFSTDGITAERKVNAPNEFTHTTWPTENQFKVAISEDVLPGIYDVWAMGRFGLSNPRRFVVGRYKEINDRAGNNQKDKAIPLGAANVVHGRVDANSRDYFRLSANAGETRVINCWAHKIDSRLVPIVTVYSVGTGRQLARASDPHNATLTFTAPTDGQYLLTVEDHTYRGGADYFYRLAVHQEAQVDAIWPPVVQVEEGTSEATVDIRVLGRNLPDGEGTDFYLGHQQLKSKDLRVSFSLGDGRGVRHGGAASILVTERRHTLPLPFASTFPATIQTTTQRVEIEHGDNDSPDAAQTIQVPSIFVGQFYPARDRDYVQFQGNKGEEFYVDVRSHQLGNRTDVAMVVEQITEGNEGKPQVKQLDRTDDADHYRRNDQNNEFNTSTTDPRFRLTINQDAVYRIRVADQFGGSRSDPRTSYQISIRRPRPSFEAVAWLVERSPDPNNVQLARVGTPALRRGGSLLFHIEPHRIDGFSGEITVRVDGLPSGVRCPPITMSSDVHRGVVIMSADADAKSWFGTVRFVASAKLEGVVRERTVQFGTLVWNSDNVSAEKPATRLTETIQLSVVEKDPAPIQVAVGDGNVVETSLGAKLTLPVKLLRTEQFKGELQLDAKQAPASTKPKQLKIAGDKSDGNFEIELTDAKIKPGIYPFRLRGQAKIKHHRNPDAVAAAEKEKVTLEKLVAELATQLGDANGKLEEAKKVAASASERVAENQRQLNDATQRADAAKRQADQMEELAKSAAAAASQATTDPSLAEANTQAQESLRSALQLLGETSRRRDDLQQESTVAQQALEAANAAQAAAESIHQELDARSKRAEAAKQTAAKRFEDAKGRNNPKDVTAIVNSTPIVLRIVPSPVISKIETQELHVLQGSEVDVPCAIERKYGFNGDVQLELTTNDVPQLAAETITIAKDQTVGALKIKANPDAPVGKHNVTVKTKLKFNNVDIESSDVFAIAVLEAAAK